MNSFTYLGIDNGASGSIGVITSSNEVFYFHTPVKKCLNYTKVKKWITRVDYNALFAMLQSYCNCSGLPEIPGYSGYSGPTKSAFALIERPLVNPMMFNASASALRSFEVTITVLENLNIGYDVVDSKEWQKVLLPEGMHKEDLKIASLDVAKRLFPKIDFKGFKDGDGLLLAEYCRRKQAHLILGEK